LSNGLRVATETTISPTATVGVFIDAGSSYETPETNGTAHFLEHLIFKGTARRTRTQLELEIENMGGTLNAFTSREQTVYYASVLKSDVGQSVDILSDILINSNLSPESIENERSVILREMQEVEKKEQEIAFDQLHAIAYQDSPLGFTILGPAENIKSITQKNVRDYIDTHYSPDRIVLVGAGGVNHESMVAAANESFGSLQKKNGCHVARPDFTGSLVTISDTSKELVHLVIALEGVEWTNPDHFVLMVLQAIVGNWNRNTGAGKNISSRLCEYVASNDLAHSITSYTTFYRQTGLFGVYAVTEPKHLEKLGAAIMNEWMRLGHTVTDVEVERAKTKLKSSLLSLFDGNQAVCQDIGLQLLTYNRRLSPAEIFARIDEIDADTIRNAVARYCHDTKPAIVAIGNVQSLDENVYQNWAQLLCV